MEKNINKILLAILAFSILSIFSAYFIEHVLGHKPCKLCLYQRYPYFVSVFLILNILILKKYIKLTLLTLALVSFFGSVIAFYHFGIEQGFFNESLVCDLGNNANLSKEQLLKQLENSSIVSCKDVTFRVLGFSLATINTIISIILSAIMIKVIKNYDKN